MGKTRPNVVYVVQRLNWVRQDDYADGSVKGLLFRIPGVIRLQSFDREADAQAERERLEEKARRWVNPFLCGGAHLRHQTSFDTDRLHDWLLDGGIEPPPLEKGKRNWVKWWPKAKESLDEPRWQHFWKALDRLVFHEVIIRPRKPVVYVLGQIGWRYNDQGFDSQPEGSKPMKAFRSRERAEAECIDENDMAVNALDITTDGFTDDNGEDYDMSERLERGEPFGQAGRKQLPAVFYEVVEVELEELEGRP